MNDDNRLQLMTLAGGLTVAWLSNRNHRASIKDVADVIKAMAAGLQGLDGTMQSADAMPAYEGAVTARKSLSSPDHIISMIDGKSYSSLTRHLTRHGLTPAEYRERYKLKADYPMVAPGYSERRRAIAQQTGLGRKRKSTSNA